MEKRIFGEAATTIEQSGLEKDYLQSETYPSFRILSLSLSPRNSSKYRLRVSPPFHHQLSVTRLPAIASPIRKFLTIQSLDR